jgi:Fe/S biogenesis protein NfuA
MITLTDAARQKFLEAAEAEGRRGDGLRVLVQNGGSIEPAFALNFVAAADVKNDDTVVDSGEIKLYIDPESARWLEGARIDFVDGLHESGFKVDAPNAGLARPSGPLADKVQRVLEERINPGVASHGGVVHLVAIEDQTVYLKFGGGCQGCGMVNVTLKQGVERVLLEEVPELKKVLDVTDHASGTNPYYQPSK